MCCRVSLLLLFIATTYGRRFCHAALPCYPPAEIDNDYYLFYDVNPAEGFNLRRDVFMRFADFTTTLRKANQTASWKLVLPPWYTMRHWRSEESQDRSIPWSTFFDVNEMKKVSPVVEISEVFEKYNWKPLVIDAMYVLVNYDDPFENGVFKEKWQFGIKPCRYNGNFWGQRNVTIKEAFCVMFQGKINKLLEIYMLNQSHKKVLFVHGEIPLHNSYGSKRFWDIRRSMKFNKELDNIARGFVRTVLHCEFNSICSSYVSVHWRRQDFAQGRLEQVPSIAGTARQIDQFISSKHTSIRSIFLSTDASMEELNILIKLLLQLQYRIFKYTPSHNILRRFTDGGVSVIDQIICAHGAYFIGTHDSTFTLRIQEERNLMGFDQSTTYNRLCPDAGVCEKSSKWPVVK